MNDAAAWIDSSEVVKRVTEAISEAMNPVCYLLYAGFRDLEELYKIGTGDQLVKSVDFLL